MPKLEALMGKEVVETLENPHCVFVAWLFSPSVLPRTVMKVITDICKDLGKEGHWGTVWEVHGKPELHLAPLNLADTDSIWASLITHRQQKSQAALTSLEGDSCLCNRYSVFQAFRKLVVAILGLSQGPWEIS